MIFYHCDKVYHANHTSFNSKFPILSNQRLDLIQCIILLSFQYSAIASKYKISEKNNTDSLLLYLFHPLTHEYKYSEIPTYLDAHSILEFYFKEDPYLKEFTTYFTSKHFKYTRTILLFPIFSISDNNLTGFVAFDLFSNDLIIISPFFAIRSNISSPTLDTSFSHRLEKSLASIVYICRSFHLVKLIRPIIPSDGSNINSESDAFIIDISSRFNINKLVIDSQYMTLNNLGGQKYVLIFCLFDKIVESIGVLGWKKGIFRNATTIDLAIAQQVSFFDFLLDVVFGMPSMLKFNKSTAFGYSTTELEAKQTIYTGILDDYKKGQFKACFDLLNFHYMHIDVEGSKSLWNIILKFSEIMGSSIVNQAFAVKHIQSLINNLSRWLSLAYMNNINFTVEKLYETLNPIINKQQLKLLLYQKLTASSSVADEESTLEIERNTAFKESANIDNESGEANRTIFNEAAVSSSKVISNSTVLLDKENESDFIYFPDFTASQRLVWQNISKASPLALLLTTSYVKYSSELKECPNTLYERRLKVDCFKELLSKEFDSIINDYDIRVMGKRSKPRLFICSFENCLIVEDNTELPKKSSYLKVLGDSTNECINKWIDSRRKTIKRFVSLKGGCCFKECGGSLAVSEAKYFIPICSMVSLFMKTALFLYDKENVTSRKFSFLLKRNIKIWLYDLPENPSIWSDEEKVLSKSIDIDAVVVNIGWFHGLFNLMNNIVLSEKESSCSSNDKSKVRTDNK